jgi:hypothetical protein
MCHVSHRCTHFIGLHIYILFLQVCMIMYTRRPTYNIAIHNEHGQWNWNALARRLGPRPIGFYIIFADDNEWSSNDHREIIETAWIIVIIAAICRVATCSALQRNRHAGRPTSWSIMYIKKSKIWMRINIYHIGPPIVFALCYGRDGI